MASTPCATLDGMAAKDTGAAPFDALKPLLAAVRVKRCRVRRQAPGLGAGQPRVGAGHQWRQRRRAGNGCAGQLVGLGFDGNRKSVSSDWTFDPAMTRSTAAQSDLRWIMTVVAPALQVPKALGVRWVGRAGGGERL
ncbi:hypothetical protein FHR61_000399 [Xanthomonas arboricola]|uniref:Uncharacterized protein n=1 Tax=Xanthomonas cannabis TaxID=1885674 RepID=A0ABR6JIT8_9XANT|nr:hypothetical protein [Xanthomonas cannabis]MBB5520603.1 hypothetical protein [Xanthomonas cannabis]